MIPGKTIGQGSKKSMHPSSCLILKDRLFFAFIQSEELKVAKDEVRKDDILELEV